MLAPLCSLKKFDKYAKYPPNSPDFCSYIYNFNALWSGYNSTLWLYSVIHKTNSAVKSNVYSGTVGVYVFSWHLPIMVKATVLINDEKDRTTKDQSYFCETIRKFRQDYEYLMY